MNHDFTITLLNILSVREDKLTILLPGRRKTAAPYGKHVWVVQAGAQPRAWCKRDTPKGGHPAVWREARFHCDALLVPPDTCHAARRKIVTSLRAALTWDHTPPPCPNPFDGNERKFAIVRARARRRINELREAGAFAGLTADETKARMEEIRTECGVHDVRRAWVNDEPEDHRLTREWNECDPLRRIWETHEEFQRLADTPDDVFAHRMWGNHDETKPVEFPAAPGPEATPVSNDRLCDRRHLRKTWLRLGQLSQWLDRFPPEAQEFLRLPFPCRRWHLLSLWQRVPASRDIIRDVPALAFAMASSHAFRAKPVRRPLRSLRSLVRGKRTNLLAWLGFPATQVMLRLLRLVPAAELSIPFLFDLRRLPDAAPDHVAELLRLARPLNHKLACMLLRSVRPSVRLLRAMLAEGAPHEGLPVIWRDTLRMARQLRRHPTAGAALERLPRVTSLRRLHEIHDQLTVTFRAKSPGLPVEVLEKFPLASPWPGEEWIMPLTTPEQVTGEAVTMFHCLDTYIGRMAEGRYFAYAVRLDDERATLGLRKEGGRWLIDQLQGPANAKVSPALRKQVADWLAAKATNIPAMQQAQAA